jgi:hypothetical protein
MLGTIAHFHIGYEVHSQLLYSPKMLGVSGNKQIYIYIYIHTHTYTYTYLSLYISI